MITADDPPADLAWLTWSRDERSLFGIRMTHQTVFRFDLATHQLETVFDIAGLGEPGVWVGVDPTGALLLHRDTSQNEIVVMDWDGG